MSVVQTKEVLERLVKAGHVRQVLGVAPQGEVPMRLDMIGPVPLPVSLKGREVMTRWYVGMPTDADSHELCGNQHVSAVVLGEPQSATAPPLVRVHSTCFTGDVMGSLRCDCGPQLEAALATMDAAPQGGMVVYVPNHEGRGIGLWAKAAAYLLQDQGLDTYEANRALGFGDDQREYRMAASVIHYLLGEREFGLLTNNPDKVAQLRAYGLTNVSQVRHVAGVGAKNHRYLCAKREHGHAIPASALAEVPPPEISARAEGP